MGRGPAEMEPINTDNKSDAEVEEESQLQGMTDLGSSREGRAKQEEGRGSFGLHTGCKWQCPAGGQKSWSGVQIWLELDSTDCGIVLLSPKASTSPSQSLHGHTLPSPTQETPRRCQPPCMGAHTGLPQAVLATPTQPPGLSVKVTSPGMPPGEGQCLLTAQCVTQQQG